MFATMHGKENLAAPAFAEQLGAIVIAPDHLDTDQFGTFAGDIPRTLSPLAAATEKARLGMQLTGLPRGLASEGSFRSSLIGVGTTEILLFVDTERGIELLERASGSSPLPAAGRVKTLNEALTAADALGFPEQGLLLHAVRGTTIDIHKTISTRTELAELVTRCLDNETALTILPDHRAHRSPSRANRIQFLCVRMALRLATPCPTCATPGYGLIDVETGLPCVACGTLTRGIAADIHGCGACTQKQLHPRRETHADPATCDHCNP
ncbi:hypothetical protein B7R25_02330 [Subtercola boreus]|uniref:DUF6671 domain-containing protein n=1 Tax=Subtercola boreus TaxID=120213 RepID=A0A3E0WDM7_9MICO|nr:hypothetical protein B7R24_02325 [Subtercola boreus]RFA23312.1 hypothetical protein B7R23_02315 [Subtercola boreus]RFA29115.1 hypothetical protein B7R25_02330 [Subtercola boreus]